MGAGASRACVRGLGSWRAEGWRELEQPQARHRPGSACEEPGKAQQKSLCRARWGVGKGKGTRGTDTPGKFCQTSEV